jgi:menaquinol-cytochrome c reductase cytochrome b/c subunit
VNRGEKEAYKRDYARAKAEGKPFFPYAVYKDVLIACLVIGIVMALAIAARVEVGEPVNPATTDFVPRPEWYFFFLFELLRIFEGQSVFTPVIMATFIIPNILMALLLLWPFIDRSAERRPHKRPIAMVCGVLVIAFLAYMTHLGAEAPAGAASEIEFENIDAQGEAGLAVFQANGCTSCHSLKGSGGNVGPELTDYGSRSRGVEGNIQLLNDPPGQVMPSFQALPQRDKEALATFLDGLGTKYQ